MKMSALKSIAVKSLFVIFVVAVFSGYCAADEEKYSNLVLRDVMAPMRDGVKLATDIYLPTDAETGERVGEKFPAILIRTPYGKTSNPEERWPQHLCRLGYAVAVQDVRGRGNSQGDFYIYINEGRDGYDAVEWVAAQPWCNGDVGTWGQSYLASLQSATAVYAPAHLKTMMIIGGPSDYINEGAGRGGAFYGMKNIYYPLYLAIDGKEAQNDPNVSAVLKKAWGNLGQLVLSAPLKKGSHLQFAPSYLKWYKDWREHPPCDLRGYPRETNLRDC